MFGVSYIVLDYLMITEPQAQPAPRLGLGLDLPIKAGSSELSISVQWSRQAFIFICNKPMTTTNLFTEVEDMSIPAGLPSTSHSMAYALMPFCNGKVPIEHISAALASQTTHDPISFLVAGVHAGAASEFAASRGLNDLGNPIWDASVHSDAAKSKSSKRFNFERPKLFSARYKSNGRSCYVLTVMPGRDYVLHYAWMVRQVWRRGTSQGTTTQTQEPTHTHTKRKNKKNK